MRKMEKQNKKMSPKLDFKTFKRLMKYLTSNFKFKMLIVFVMIILSTVSSVAGSLYMQILIDDYITPLIGAVNPILIPFFKAIGVMIIIYLVGVIAGLIQSLLMVDISEGTLKRVRDEMFVKMEKLPIKYFDTHTHGDIMSHYTNDIDTLSQMITQGLPQMITSAITIVTVFVSMVVKNAYLTGVVILSLFVMLKITKIITKMSAKYFIGQQDSVAKVNGYVEEMINGQKVIKVFCHEEITKEEFDKYNEELCENAYKANKYANILMPVLGALRKYAIYFGCSSWWNNGN